MGSLQYSADIPRMGLRFHSRQFHLVCHTPCKIMRWIGVHHPRAGGGSKYDDSNNADNGDGHNLSGGETAGEMSFVIHD
jgi:hypothetical protein